MNDTRTDAERRYDATRLSPLDQADTLIRAVLAPAATVDVEYLYYDERRALRELTEEACGPLAFTTYICGHGREQAGITFQMDGTAGPVSSLFNRDPHPLATVLAAVANLQTLLADPRVHAALHGATPPATPAITVTTWQSEDGVSFTDFHTGAGLTRASIGTYGDDKPGLELVVGGNGINEMIDEVLTLADVRQLRDNLTALLEDTRLQAAERAANARAAARMVDACLARQD